MSLSQVDGVPEPWSQHRECSLDVNFTGQHPEDEKPADVQQQDKDETPINPYGNVPEEAETQPVNPYPVCNGTTPCDPGCPDGNGPLLCDAFESQQKQQALDTKKLSTCNAGRGFEMASRANKEAEPRSQAGPDVDDGQ